MKELFNFSFTSTMEENVSFGQLFPMQKSSTTGDGLTAQTVGSRDDLCKRAKTIVAILEYRPGITNQFTTLLQVLQSLIIKRLKNLGLFRSSKHIKEQENTVHDNDEHN